MSAAVKKITLALIFLSFAAGCGNSETITDAASATVTPVLLADTPRPSPSPTWTATPTSSPTPTFSPTPTPTPTATAVSLSLSGDPRAVRLSSPIVQSGAPCGLVDLLDFPLDPPDAAGVTYGGQDFGIFRRRYDKYHAGEDWWGVNRRTSFGTPVYSIGHGRVTYAAPSGWGRDQGVLIVRHRFNDGSTFLSFYGHLDPPSVLLNVGDCVTRGDQVGKLGRPRSTPHLHFEIRTHMPVETGGGYWFEDPTLAGWLPPSQTIWTNRVASAPGVMWTRPLAAVGTNGVGLLDEETVVVIEDGRLLGVDMLDGHIRWQHPNLEKIGNALLDEPGQVIYTASRQGLLEAYRLPQAGEDFSELTSEPLWTTDFEVIGFPMLMPLPQGGLVLAVWGQMFAVSAQGRLLWTHEIETRPFHWNLIEDQLILTTTGKDGAIWVLDESGAVEWIEGLNGRVLSGGNQIWIYEDEGIYRLNQESKVAELIYALPRSFLGLGDAVALPDGRLLLAHRDRFDQRLLLFNVDGTVNWQRSYRDAILGQPSFFVLDNQVYLASHNNAPSFSELKVYAVDLENSRLTHIFTGGTRSPVPADTWIIETSYKLALINMGGGDMAAFDPRTAYEMITNP